MTLSPLAAAMASAITDSRTRRVPLGVLWTAAAATDRSGAVAVTWRARIAAAIDELAAAGLIDLPTTKWDRSTDPPLPSYVMRVAAVAVPPAVRAEIVWHAQLGWAAQLDAAGLLNPADRRALAGINAWLRRRGETVVPQRERSLDIFGDEKVLDGLVFGPLFGTTRLTHEMLRCEPCWPPVQQEILGGGPWLVVENWTTFKTLAGYARRSAWDGRLIWGAGNQAGTRLESLAASGEKAARGIWYFGDVDTPGLGIARMADDRAFRAGLGPVRPATALYDLCLAAGSARPGRKSLPEALSRWILDWMGQPLGSRLVAVLERKEMIVQETVGVELLAAQRSYGLLP